MPVRRTSIVVLVAAAARVVAGRRTDRLHRCRARPRPPCHSRAPAARVVGQPPAQATPCPANSYFGYPNAGKTEPGRHPQPGAGDHQQHLGWPADCPTACPPPSNGTIRIATWSFKDRTIARALVAARNRGVSVQVMAAKARNAPNPQWRCLKKQLGTGSLRPGHPETVDQVSFARECRGSCRGRGGTPHAKYFLFTNVGASHVHEHRHPDLDEPHLDGLPRPVEPGRGHRTTPAIYNDFMAIYRQTRIGVPVGGSAPLLRPRRLSPTSSSRFHANASTDPVMRTARPGHSAPAPASVRRAAAPGSGSSSTRSTATAASGSPRSCVSCGTPAATSR